MRRTGTFPSKLVTHGQPHRRLVAFLFWAFLPLSAMGSAEIPFAEHLDLPGAAPVVTFVDLSGIDVTDGTADRDSEADSPLLFLAPRVASILEDVFGSNKNASADEDSDDPGTRERPKDVSSPVAGTADAPEQAEGKADLYEDDVILPRFQRQMYRTDI